MKDFLFYCISSNESSIRLDGFSLRFLVSDIIDWDRSVRERGERYGNGHGNGFSG